MIPNISVAITPNEFRIRIAFRKPGNNNVTLSAMALWTSFEIASSQSRGSFKYWSMICRSEIKKVFGKKIVIDTPQSDCAPLFVAKLEKRLRSEIGELPSNIGLAASKSSFWRCQVTFSSSEPNFFSPGVSHANTNWTVKRLTFRKTEHSCTRIRKRGLTRFRDFVRCSAPRKMIFDLTWKKKKI